MPAEREPQIVAGILAAYRQGYFPMAMPSHGRRPGAIRWYNPDPRAILPLAPGGLHVSRSLRRRLRQSRFHITADAAFSRVIEGCAQPRPDSPDSWIDERIMAAYVQLHEAGWAHSIEAWLPSPDARDGNDDRAADPGLLVGGIYGVRIGAAFFAESMFCRPEQGGTDASKICLVHLVHHLRRRGFGLLDVQMANAHTERFGVIEISREEYLERLARATAAQTDWLPLRADLTVAELEGAAGEEPGGESAGPGGDT